MSKSKTVFQNRGSIHTDTQRDFYRLRAKFREVLGVHIIPWAKHFGIDRAVTALERTLANGFPLAAC